MTKLNDLNKTVILGCAPFLVIQKVVARDSDAIRIHMSERSIDILYRTEQDRDADYDMLTGPVDAK
jgi:hypothetical protein